MDGGHHDTSGIGWSNADGCTENWQLLQKNAKKLAVTILAGLLAGCKSYTEEDIVGLWQLEEVEIDAMRQPVSRTFFEVKPNRIFAVSRVGGDLAGVYRLEQDRLRLFSTDLSWFNNSWSMYRFKEHLDLKGRDEHSRYARLRFRKIDRVPTFEEFADRVTGKWQLYKVRSSNDVVERLTDTWFQIDDEGNYSITSAGLLQDQGTAVIDTRHKKIVFADNQKEWSAWFYGNELRLSNAKSGIEYSLRKRE